MKKQKSSSPPSASSTNNNNRLPLYALGSLGLFITLANSETVLSHFLSGWKEQTPQTQHESATPLLVNKTHYTTPSPATPSPRMCRTYLAPSTLPGAGLGLFAGTAFEQGDQVTPGDAVVPLQDIDWNNYYKTDNKFLWDDYIWSGSTFVHMTDPLFMDIDGASFGIGAIPNCHFGLLNVEETPMQHDIESTVNGAYTNWYDRQGIATQQIHAGQELFVDYGYAYFEGSRTETIGYIPLTDDFVKADTLLHGMGVMLKRIQGWEQDNALYDDDTLLEDVYETVQGMIQQWPESRLAMALPARADEIAHVLATGGTAKKDEPRSIHSLAFLQEYGSCTDHLVVQPSTLPQAGRGAFAVRDLPRGSVVAPVPLIHLPERSVLNVHSWGLLDPDDGEPFWGELVHEQLLLNYCWGHDDTTLVLCPYGVVSSMINHHSEHANVKMVWSNKTTVHPEWWNMAVEEWAYDNGSGLCMEYIALRDIQAGEEVLIDYGDAWQTAWNEHQQQHVKEDDRYFVDHLNADLEAQIPTTWEWTYSQGDPNVDPQAVTLWCYNAYREMQGLLLAYEKAYPCRVMVQNDDGTYIAEIVARLQNADGEEGQTEHEKKQCFEVFDEVLWSIPRDAMAYGGPFDVDSPREHMNPRSFRHEMRLPDDLLPQAWRNVVKE